MEKILFVCHGNICRSPMAEFVMKDMVEKRGLATEFEIASAATSTEELGNPVYPPARRLLLQHGIDPAGKRARQMKRADYAYYDLIVGMDEANIRNIIRITGGDPDGKVSLLLDHVRPEEAGTPRRSVADPWYTGNFQITWDDVNRGCAALLAELGYEQSYEGRRRT